MEVNVSFVIGFVVGSLIYRPIVLLIEYGCIEIKEIFKTKNSYGRGFADGLNTNNPAQIKKQK